MQRATSTPARLLRSLIALIWVLALSHEVSDPEREDPRLCAQDPAKCVVRCQLRRCLQSFLEQPSAKACKMLDSSEMLDTTER